MNGINPEGDQRKRYAVNEIFYSLQGEGCWAGTPMVFVRFSGCNLCCPFCDTDFASGTRMSLEEILEAVRDARPDVRRICVTGGEPSLQLDDAFVALFHAAGYRLHVETNGTHPLPEGIDWITCSPKSDFVDNAALALTRADELKVVYTGQNVTRWLDFPATQHLLQPCSGLNTEETAAYVCRDPRWRLSLQIHKTLGIR